MLECDRLQDSRSHIEGKTSFVCIALFSRASCIDERRSNELDIKHSSEEEAPGGSACG